MSGSVRLAGTARHESSVTSVLGCAGASVSVSVTFSAFAVFHADPLEAGVSVSWTDCTLPRAATASRLPTGTVAPMTRYFAATESTVPSAASASMSAASGGVE
ncbi:hypothetical protein ACFPRL_18240 [Pseudoclavibacter helvolus]